MKPAYGREDAFGIERSCGVRNEFAGEAGAALREAREAVGFSLKQVAGATRIRLDYLAALEDGDPRQMPPKAYAVAYARTYADFLGLDAAEIAEAMKAEYLFAEAKQLKLVKSRPSRERRIPRGLAGAAAVIALSVAAMTWYGMNAPARSAGSMTPPAPEALMRWSFEAAPPDKSVWSALAEQAGMQAEVWEASAPLPEEPMRPAHPSIVDLD
jgi:transcriptional regulator with XRE-family HTH domain